LFGLVNSAVRQLRVFVGAALLLLAAFVAIFFVFENSDENRPNDSGQVVQVVNAIASLRRDYLDLMQATVAQAYPACRDAPPSSGPSACKDLVDQAARLDPVVLDVIATLEAFQRQRDLRSDEALAQGIQRNLKLARLAHEFNLLLGEAWSQNDQTKWDAAWSAWDRLTSERAGG